MSTVVLEVTSSVRPLGSLLVAIFPLCYNLKVILLVLDNERFMILAGIPLGEVSRRFPADTLILQNQGLWGNTEKRPPCKKMHSQEVRQGRCRKNAGDTPGMRNFFRTGILANLNSYTCSTSPSFATISYSTGLTKNPRKSREISPVTTTIANGF